MPDEKDPYDPTILCSMTNVNTFRGKSIEELACLISIAEKILKEQTLGTKESLFTQSQYHLPLNYLAAMKAWREYKVMKDRSNKNGL